MSTQAPVVASRQWGRRLATAVLVLVCWVSGMLVCGMTLEKYPDVETMSQREDLFIWIDIVVGCVACALLPLVRSGRRRRAGVGALLVAACSLVSSWAGPAGLYALVRVASWRDHRWTAAVAGLTCVASLGYLAIVPGEALDPASTIAMPVLVTAVVGWGMYRGSKAALVDSYRERAEVLQREQTARVAQARAEERTAIAREMHDTLSHRLAVISLHAGGLQVRPDREASQVAQAATIIQTTTQEASEELRILLTVLRDDAGDRRQGATLADLDELLGEARAMGVQATLTCDATLRSRLGSLPAQRSAALAHAIREGMANVLKHALGASVAVRVDEADSGVRVTVTNRLAARPSELAGGYGLVGLDERLRLARGWMRHGTRDGHHELQAWVPWN